MLAPPPSIYNYWRGVEIANIPQINYWTVYVCNSDKFSVYYPILHITFAVSLDYLKYSRAHFISLKLKKSFKIALNIEN